MTLAALKEKIEHAIPFTIHVADGRSYDVPHEDFIWMPPRCSSVVVVAAFDEEADETLTHTIPLLMVSGVTETAPH